MRTCLSPLPCGLLLLLLGCGGSPTIPSSPAPPPAVTPSLQPGAYYLVVSNGSSTVPSPVAGDPLNAWICMGVGSYPNAVQVPVTVAGEGGKYRARAVTGSLLLDMTVSGSAASGILQGSADDGTGGFSISVQGAEPAGIDGSVTSDHTAGGTVVGSITLTGPQGFGGCSPARWSLEPR